MRLSDLMAGMDLAVYPTIALVIFLGVFWAVARRAWRMPKPEQHHAATLPLRD